MRKFLFNYLLLGSLLISTTLTETAFCRAKYGDHPFGLGVMFGEPTGITAKYWHRSTQALDFGVTYSFGNYVILLADYLWHFPNAFSSITHGKAASEFAPYIGVGGTLSLENNRRNSNHAQLGVRIPLGIEFRPSYPSLGIFLELVPAVAIAPSVFGFLQGGIGIRYYF
jgi:hypothetical protein